MNATRFRQLLIVCAALIVSAVAAGLLPGGYSQALGDAYANEPAPVWLENEGLAIVVLLALLAATVAGFVGLFMLKRWGRSLSLWLTVIGLPLYLLMGPTLSSPLEAMLTDASTLVWGACLALAYFSLVATRFEAGAAGP